MLLFILGCLICLPRIENENIDSGTCRGTAEHVSENYVVCLGWKFLSEIILALP